MRHQHNPFHKGQRLWVQEPDGTDPRPAVFVGDDARMGAGSFSAYVVFDDSRRWAEVPIARLTARED